MSQLRVADIEKAVLVKLIKEPTLIYDVLGYLKNIHFDVKQYSLIYKAMEDLASNNTDIGYLVLLSKLTDNKSFDKLGDEDFLKELFEDIPSSDDVKDLCELIIKNYKKRCAVKIGYDLSSLHKMDSDNIEANLSEISRTIDNLISDSSGSFTDSIQNVLREEWEEFEVLIKNPGITGIETGVADLDLMLSGYNPTNMIIIAARPSVGKTSLALRQVLDIAKKNIPVMMFSYEMSKKELSQRMVSMESGINLLNIRTGAVSDKEFEEIKRVYLEIGTYPIYIDTNASAPLGYVLSTIRRYVRSSGVKVVFVDYIQLMSRDTDNETHEIGKISRALKVLAQELGITVVILSQLNRLVESRENKRPQLSDLRQSGNLEEDANAVLMLYRPALYGKVKDDEENLCEILIRKNRNGPTGTVNTYFDGTSVNIYSTLNDYITAEKKKKHAK